MASESADDPEYRPRELMVAAAAREIDDGDVAFVGMCLPLLAFQVAVSTHAPGAMAVYEGRPGERDAARQALFTTVSASLRMLSPFAPFLTEEVWHALPETEGSVHASSWPDLGGVDGTGERTGAIIADAASTIRSWKSDQGMALNAPLAEVEVYPDDQPASRIDTYDLSEAVNAPVRIREGDPTVELVAVGVEPDHAALGPEFRDRTDRVIEALESMDSGTIRSEKRLDGEIEVDLGNEVVVVPGSAVDVVEAHRSAAGETVAVLEGVRSTILVHE